MDIQVLNQILWNVGFLLVTYVPLQVMAIRRQEGVNRGAAMIPILFMGPMMVAACFPSMYADGSLFAMYYCCPYLPAIVFLAVGAFFSARKCPECGATIRRASFQATPKLCPKCAQAKVDRETSRS